MTTVTSLPRPDQASLAAFLQRLDGQPPDVWLAQVQQLVLRRELSIALALLDAASVRHPCANDVRVAKAGLWIEAGDRQRGEELLREALAREPRDIPAGFALARLLRDQGRAQGAAAVLLSVIPPGLQDPETILPALDLLGECDRKREAAELCEQQIAAGSSDPRIHVYSAMLLAQLGEFALARQRYDFVLAHSPYACEWHVPHGLSSLQRYQNDTHADFALFHDLVPRDNLSPAARASLLFAMGKAFDDIGHYAQAAHHLRQANQIAGTQVSWSRKQWKRSVEARLRRTPPEDRLPASPDWTPVFIVGLPRSGSTLLGELLGRHAQACNRGELPWLPTLMQQLDHDDAEQLTRAAAAYASRLRQDDSDARWFIDKQPHNYMHVDRILAMFPQARILHCDRHARDNALSIWMQSFQPGTQDFACDFADIGAVVRGTRRLMQHWASQYPQAVLTVRYEQLVSDPEACLDTVATWLGLPAADLLAAPDSARRAISTASLWQARQPIHTGSIGRWRHYAAVVPELLDLPDA